VGSVVAGDADFIRRARRMRKVVGGGMRQAGVIAAAGIESLTNMLDRLADDHANAQILAQGLAAMDGIAIDPALVETNLVYFDVVRENLSAAQLSAGLVDRGVLMSPVGAKRLRAVANYHISPSDMEQTLAAIEMVVNAAPADGTAVVSTYG